MYQAATERDLILNITKIIPQCPACGSATEVHNIATAIKYFSQAKIYYPGSDYYCKKCNCGFCLPC